MGFENSRTNSPPPRARDEEIGTPMEFAEVGVESGAIGETPGAYSTIKPTADADAEREGCCEALARAGEVGAANRATIATRAVARNLNFT